MVDNNENQEKDAKEVFYLYELQPQLIEAKALQNNNLRYFVIQKVDEKVILSQNLANYFLTVPKLTLEKLLKKQIC